MTTYLITEAQRDLLDEAYKTLFKNRDAYMVQCEYKGKDNTIKAYELLQSLPMVDSRPAAHVLGLYADSDQIDVALPMGTPLYTSPQALTKLPEPIFTKVADGIELGHNLWGGIAIRLGGEFTYVQVNYNHEYTDNATRARLADNIVKLIQGEVPHPQTLAPITAEMVTDEMIHNWHANTFGSQAMGGVTDRDMIVAAVNAYNAVIKHRSGAR